ILARFWPTKFSDHLRRFRQDEAMTRTMWTFERTSAGRTSRLGSGVAVAALLLIGTSIAGCSRIAQLQASRAAKGGNAAYAAPDYAHAAELYQEALNKNPGLAFAYFYLGNSYEQQYKPSRRGEADNDVLLTKAVENYKIAAQKLAIAQTEQERNLANLSLKYLVS